MSVETPRPVVVETPIKKLIREVNDVIGDSHWQGDPATDVKKFLLLHSMVKIGREPFYTDFKRYVLSHLERRNG